MKVFILAGGFATRLWPLTEKRAKPLLPLAGKPLLTHLVEKIPEGIPVTVSTNAVFAEDFEIWKIENGKLKMEILIEDVGHEDEKLGALGAVARWITEESINDDILLLAGDNYVGFSIEEFVRQYDEKPKYNGKPFIALHDIGPKEKASQFGTVIVDGGTMRVTGFEEKPTEPKTTNVSTGVYILPKDYLQPLVDYAKQKPDNIGGVFEHFLNKGHEFYALSFNEPWFDIGSFEAYLEATKVLAGETPSTDGNTFKGSVVIGKNSCVKNSTLTDVVAFEDCNIDDCVLERCIIDNGCHLCGIDLSGKMLREGTKLIR